MLLTLNLPVGIPEGSAAQDVHTDQIEMAAGGEHVAIVRVDFAEPVLPGTAEMNGIAGPEERASGQPHDALADRPDQGRGHREPAPDTRRLVAREVIEHIPRLARGDVSLAKMPLDDARKLESRQLAGGQSVRVVRQCPDALRPRLIQVTLRDVRCVEVDQPRSRMAD